MGFVAMVALHHLAGSRLLEALTGPLDCVIMFFSASMRSARRSI
jgi:hypothetical protein